MKKRIELKVTGQVQWVGYRSRVDNQAKRLQLTGTVENLLDGTVRIICEGQPSDLKEFLEMIELNEGYIQVEKVTVIAKGDATGEFTHFKVIQGELVEELKGSFDQGLLRLKASTDQIKEAIDESRDLLQSELRSVDNHQTKNMETLTHETQSFKEQTHADLEQTHADFSDLDVKYDRVSTSLESIDEHVQDVSHALNNLSQALLKTVNSKG